MAIQRSPKLKKTMNIVSPVGSEALGSPALAPPTLATETVPGTQSWASIAKVKRKYQHLILEFTPEVEDKGKDNPRVSLDNIVGPYVFDDLKIEKSELQEIRVFGNHTKVVKFKTKSDIVVSQRWKDLPSDIVKEFNGIRWICKVKGLKKKEVKLRIINPPEEATELEIIEEVSKFAKASAVRDESVTKGQSLLFEGMSNGNKVVLIEEDHDTIPDSIELGGRSTKVLLLKPRCFKCNELGHVAKNCDKEECDNREHKTGNVSKGNHEEETKSKNEHNKLAGVINLMLKSGGKSPPSHDNTLSILNEDLDDEEAVSLTEDGALPEPDQWPNDADKTESWFDGNELDTAGSSDDQKILDKKPETRKAKNVALTKIKSST